MLIIKSLRYFIFILFLLIAIIGCTRKTVKQTEGETVSLGALADEASSAAVETKSHAVDSGREEKQQIIDGSQQDETIRSRIPKSKEVDLNKIYEQSEVVRAFPPFSNSQLIDFIIKNFKYPDIEPVNGKGLVDLVIERDGTVSDVIIVEGIHPAIDKEFIRVFKLFPPFTPGKIDGTPVRSKFRAPINATAK